MLGGQEDALGAVGNGGKTAAAWLHQFGVEANDTSGHVRPTIDVLHDLADGFSRSGDAAAKMKGLSVLMGKGSEDMLLMLEQGSAGLR